jgi:gp32 DNA binding protein like
MSKFNLEALKAQFTTKPFNESNNTYYPFWGMTTGSSAKVRFLPDLNEDNPLGFLIKKMYHELYINGEKKKVPCLKQYDPQDECPICKAAAAYYKAEGKDSPNGKKYYRKVQYLGHVLILDDPLPANPETGETYKNTIKYIQLQTKIYDSIKDAFESGEFDEIPIDYKQGTNFIIKKTQSGDWADYSRSKFENKPSSLDDETIELVKASLVDLKTLLPVNPGYDKVEAMFNAALNGVGYNQNEIDKEDDVENYSAPTPTPTPILTKTIKPISTSTSKTEPIINDNDDTIDQEAEAILASLRARRPATQ